MRLIPGSHKTGRERLWAAIREKRSFTQNELAAATGITLFTTQRMVQALVRIGHLQASSTAKPGRPGRYELARDTGPRAPILKKDGRVYDPNLGEIFAAGEGGAGVISTPFAPDGLGIRRAWQAMRIVGTFNTFEIAATAEISYDQAKRYVQRLARAGYLRLVRKAVLGQAGSYHTYQLIRDTGPDAPICHRRSGRVYDPNLNQVFEPAGAQEEGKV